MHPGNRQALYVAVAAVALVSLVAPVAYVSGGGQLFLFGVPVTPGPTGECATFGCHCVVRGSILGTLVGIGYRQSLGCP